MPRLCRRMPILGVANLTVHMMYFGVDRLPPVTLATIATQVAIYLRFVPVPWNISTACISVRKILYLGHYRTFLFSVLEHADDIHLYYNMVSYMPKGRSLELQMGSGRFALLQTVFMGCCGLMYILLASLASKMESDPSYIDQCCVGFSGVIFALKILTTFDSPTYRTIVPGIQVPMKWLVWIELLLIQMLTPSESFLGHLAGILVGLLYVFGPLGYLMDCLESVIFGQPYSRLRVRNSGDYEFEGNSPNSEFYMTEEEQMAVALRRSRQDRGNICENNEANTWNQADQDAEMQLAMYENASSSNAPSRSLGQPQRSTFPSNLGQSNILEAELRRVDSDANHLVRQRPLETFQNNR